VRKLISGGAAFFLFCLPVSTTWSFDLPEHDRRAMQGNAAMWEVTTKCDQTNIQRVETGLSRGQQTTLWYRFEVRVAYRDGQRVNVDIHGHDFQPQVRQCIIDGFLRTQRWQAPTRGGIQFVPVEYRLPVRLTGR
jgi:hypothetical protein